MTPILIFVWLSWVCGLVFTKQGFDTAEEVLTQSYPWLFDWLEVINQVEIDPTQRVIIITREVECTPYQCSIRVGV